MESSASRLALLPAASAGPEEQLDASELGDFQRKLLDGFLVSQRATTGASSVHNTLAALRANYFPWVELHGKYVWEVTPDDLDQWALGLKNSVMTRTHQQYFRHVQQFYEWLIARRGDELKLRLGVDLRNPVDRFNRARRLPEGERLVPVPREEAIEFVLAASKARISASGSDAKWLQACRNYALWSLLNWAGLRRSEAVALERDDIDLVGGILRIREGKGGKGRLVHIQPPLAGVLRWYLHDVRPQLSCAWRVPRVFLNSRHTAIDPDGVRNLLHREQVDARLPGDDQFTCHGFRRAYATRLYKALRDQQFRDPLVYVKEQLGHVYLSTTQQYCQLDDDYKYFLVRDAADALVRHYGDIIRSGGRS